MSLLFIFTCKDYSTGVKASSIPFETRPSDLNDNTLEACFVGGEQLEGLQQAYLGSIPDLSLQFSGYFLFCIRCLFLLPFQFTSSYYLSFTPPLISTQIGGRASNDDIKIESNKL